MKRFTLVYRGDSIELAPGETLVGRALSCRLRFNDPAVSRVHARFMLIGQVLTLEDLGSSNGTRINGMEISGASALQNNDHVQIGHRWLQVVTLPGTHSSDDEPNTLVRRGGVGEEDSQAEEQTLDRQAEWTDAPTTSPNTLLDAATETSFDFPELQVRNCPQCRHVVAATIEKCPKCGHAWPAGRPTSVTQRIKLEAIDRRVGRRKIVQIPVLYASDTLTIDTMAHDISPGGIFVASELLDPIDTECTITILPDGAPAVTLNGTVCRVVQSENGNHGRPPGMGIRFSSLNVAAERWLTQILHGSDPGDVPGPAGKLTERTR